MIHNAERQDVKKQLLCLSNKYSQLIDYLIRQETKCYKRFSIKTETKIRTIEEPLAPLSMLQKEIVTILQKLPRPGFCYGCYRFTGTIENAKKHRFANHIITADITNYYLSTKSEFVKEFFNELLESEEQAEIYSKLCTIERRLPTGAPTSPLVGFWTNYKLFKEIENMLPKNCRNSVYYDDLTISSKTKLDVRFIKNVEKILKKHNLKLNTQKTRSYGYKKGKITGLYLNQSGAISVPFSKGHKVAKILEEIPIREMDLKMVEKTLGLINYVRIDNPKAFAIPKAMLIKRLKKLKKTETPKVQTRNHLRIQNKILKYIRSLQISSSTSNYLVIDKNILCIAKSEITNYFAISNALFYQLCLSLNNYFDINESSDSRSYLVTIKEPLLEMHI